MHIFVGITVVPLAGFSACYLRYVVAQITDLVVTLPYGILAASKCHWPARFYLV